MHLDPKLWRHFGGSQLLVDAVVLGVLGGMEAFILIHPGSLSPLEGSLLVAGTGFLLIQGRRALAWPRAVPVQAFLPEWAERILAGERHPTPPPHDLAPEQLVVAQALLAAMEEILTLRGELAFLRRSLGEDWADADGELDRLEQAWEEGILAQARVIEEMEALGRELRERVEAPDLLARAALRARELGADAGEDRAHFQEEAAQLRQEVERLGELIGQVKDSVPQLRREAERLTALGFSAGRRASRLWASIQSLSGQTQRLLESSRERAGGLARLREAGSRFAEEGEDLRRRMAQLRIHRENREMPLACIEKSLQAIGQVAHQTGLLAVNAAILAQEQRGSQGFQLIGSKIRLLAEQTTLGTTEVNRGVAEHRQELDAETRRLGELQEVADQALATLQDFQILHAQLDHQGTELERSLESHADQVRALEAAGASASESLREIQTRAESLESAVIRQQAVEQEAGKGKEEILFRMDRVEGHAIRLLRSEESALADLGMAFGCHARLRNSAPFRAFQNGHFQSMGEELARVRTREHQSWHRLKWFRTAHRRLLPPSGDSPIEGMRDDLGRLHLFLLRKDALGLPRSSALADLRSDLEGRHWKLRLRPELNGQDGVLALMAGLREALSVHWIAQPEVLMEPDGARLNLGIALPDLPGLIAGLEARMVLPEGHAEPIWQPHFPVHRMEQRFLWMHPSLPREVRAHLAAGLHDQVAHLPAHESLLPDAPRAEHSLCMRCVKGVEGRALMAAPSVVKTLRPFGVAADPLASLPWIEAMGLPTAISGDSPLVLGAVALPLPCPEALLLALTHPSAALGFDDEPALRRIREVFQREVLAAWEGDATARAWSLLEELVAGEWLAPLPG